MRALKGLSLTARVIGEPLAAAPLNAKHERLERRLLDLLEERGKRLSDEQNVLVRVFLTGMTHSRLDDLLDSLRETHPEASMATVKSTMDLLVELGVAHSFLAKDERVYEHEHLSEHHDHLVCVKCDRIEEFYDEEIEEHQTQAAARAGFRPFYHRLTIHGLCRECLNKAPAFRPLSEAQAGERVTIAHIGGGHGMTNRLRDMGLTQGMSAEVVGNSGAITLMARGTRMAIGHGMATRILVNASLPDVVADE